MNNDWRDKNYKTFQVKAKKVNNQSCAYEGQCLHAKPFREMSTSKWPRIKKKEENIVAKGKHVFTILLSTLLYV